MDITPLLNDEFTGEPSKRGLSYIQSRRQEGAPVVGIYCGFAPMELIRAMGAVPAILCAFSNKPVSAAEEVLPANLCPLIKSSYGFIITDTCPFYALSEAVVAETTCDGKKKMFELIADRKPLHVMDLPQVPDEVEAHRNWTVMVRKLQSFLETTFGRTITDEAIEAQIKDSNQRNAMLDEIFSYAEPHPPLISWSEIYDIVFLAQLAGASELEPMVEEIISRLKQRKEDGIHFGTKDSPRVLVTGCPVGGDATKVFRIIEELGGVIVALDACSGMKPFMARIEEDNPDPVSAIASRYITIPCSCMTPNTRRLTEMDKVIERFSPDAVIEVVLHACHSYNVEAYKIAGHVTGNHGLPYLKIETDYSTGDVEQIRTRVEALFDSL